MTDQPQDPITLEIEKRRADTLAEMHKALAVIMAKPQETLTKQDKGFLQARRGYLSKAEKDEYADVLAEDLQVEKKDVPAQPKKLKDMNRSELNESAIAVGIVKPEELNSNKDVINAITQIQAK